MLLSKPCPFTGVVNFYHESEPHIAIGSITKCIAKNTATESGPRYAWRFYALEGSPSGFADDEYAAEVKLRAVVKKTSTKRILEYH